MYNHIPEWGRRLAHVWRDLAAGELDIYVEPDLQPELLPRPIQTQAREAISSGLSLDGLEVEGRFWWMRASARGDGSRMFVVAWSNEYGRWGALLQEWVDLLFELARQERASSDLTGELIRSWDRLSFLYELTRTAGRVEGLPDLYAAIVRLLSQVAAARQVFLVIAEGRQIIAMTSTGDSIPDPGILLEGMAGGDRPLTLRELEVWISNPAALPEVEDLVAAPIRVQGQILGVVGAMDPPGSRFDSNDLQLLASVADQVGALIEVSLSRERREKQLQLEHELTIAARIQKGLLPDDLPQIPGFEFSAFLRPASRVGGDFYDIARTESGETMILIADVAGRGIPAALLTSIIHATFQSECAHHEDPNMLLEGMNRLAYQDLHRAGAFVTALAARIDPGPQTFSYASAGHVDAAVWRARDGVVDFYPATGLPLGVKPDQEYGMREVSLAPRDAVLFYSDGVTEAKAENGKVLGVQGLSDIIHAAQSASGDDQIGAIVDALEVHRDGLPLEDDVALFHMRFLPDVSSREEIVVPFVVAARPGAIRKLVQMTREICAENATVKEGGNSQFANEFALALTEIVSNQIEHAYGRRPGRIQGRFTLGSGGLAADIYDNGVPFEAWPDFEAPGVDPSDPPERGYGLRLALALTDQCEYHRLEGGRNHWHLMKELSGVKRDETER